MPASVDDGSAKCGAAAGEFSKENMRRLLESEEGARRFLSEKVSKLEHRLQQMDVQLSKVLRALRMR